MLERSAGPPANRSSTKQSAISVSASVLLRSPRSRRHASAHNAPPRALIRREYFHDCVVQADFGLPTGLHLVLYAFEDRANLFSARPGLLRRARCLVRRLDGGQF